MKVYAPGKLILSGEHAVVYGKPALAMAVNRYVTATLSREVRPHISFNLTDIAHHSRLSLSGLQQLKERIKRKYHRFIRGEYTIRKVLQKPFELAQFALGTLMDARNFSLPHGVNIQVQSTIPIGCGMGSSAATILCVMYAVAHYSQLSLAKETLFQLALEAENMQHGHSSGLDLQIALQGGCLYMHENVIHPRALPSFAMYLVNTGTPLVSTGQCVEAVAKHFTSSTLGDEFAAVTNAMDAALQADATIQAYIRENHQLLIKIGVVPDKVQQFIAQIENHQGAAKICGAGAITGEPAGVVLVLLEDKKWLAQLCMQYGYSYLPISGEARGVHVI